MREYGDQLVVVFQFDQCPCHHHRAIGPGIRRRPITIDHFDPYDLIDRSGQARNRNPKPAGVNRLNGRCGRDV
jgi:hypothetical protein